MNTQTHTPVIRGLDAPAPVVKLDALSRAASRRMNRVRMQQRVEAIKRALASIGVSPGAVSEFVQGMAAGIVAASSVFLFVLALTGVPK